MDPDSPIAPYLGRMEREVERLSRLARGLMRLATPQAQPGHPVDLNRLVEEALTLIQAKANVQKVTLVYSLAPRSLVVLADPDRILQFLLNLLLNACQAMPDGGRLTVTTARRASSPERPDSPAESPEAPVSTPDAAVVTVSDTGHGIAPEHLPKIFEPFFTTKGAEAGTGLGLTLAARIVKELGGTITVESRVGEGTTFTVTLPSAPPAA
jgi:two-component system NtrC family sensor kinase